MVPRSTNARSLHDHERALVEVQPAVAVVLDDLELAHAVAHRAAAVVVRLQRVRERAARRRPADREALRAVAGGDVGVELAARRPAGARRSTRGRRARRGCGSRRRWRRSPSSARSAATARSRRCRARARAARGSRRRAPAPRASRPRRSGPGPRAGCGRRPRSGRRDSGAPRRRRSPRTPRAGGPASSSANASRRWVAG